MRRDETAMSTAQPVPPPLHGAITERQRTERDLRETLSLLNATFESTTDGILVVDLAGHIISFNRIFTELWRIPDSILEAKDSAQTLAFVLEQLVDPAGFLNKIRELYARPDASSFDVLTFKDGRIYERFSQPQRIAGKSVGRVWTFRDVTDAKRAEQIQLATYRISEAAHAARTLQELFGAIHRIVGELMPAKNFYIALYDAANDHLTFPYHVDEYDSDFPSKKPGKGLTEYVLRTGQPLLVTPEVHAELERRGEVELIGPASIDWVGVPLKIGDRTIGVLVAQTYTPGVRYRDTEKHVLQFVSTQVAMAIERKRTEEQLHESERKYRLLFETNPEPMFVYDLETLRILAVNGAAVAATGTRSPSSCSSHCAIFARPRSRADSTRSWRAGPTTVPYAPESATGRSRASASTWISSPGPSSSRTGTPGSCSRAT